ncbi:hypothetical protein L798_04795 [Zootermopsis nevadensis]|uniref:Uncharacterized protein n=1 Tax=Zootermopsis nevadensis TaxID=136037 RepID=A0A067RMI2_ZOONE|nr:hypothetical protein L798_04795 [Zootermopsis nevadensis]
MCIASALGHIAVHTVCERTGTVAARALDGDCRSSGSWSVTSKWQYDLVLSLQLSIKNS